MNQVYKINFSLWLQLFTSEHNISSITSVKVSTWFSINHKLMNVTTSLMCHPEPIKTISKRLCGIPGIICYRSPKTVDTIKQFIRTFFMARWVANKTKPFTVCRTVGNCYDKFVALSFLFVVLSKQRTKKIFLKQKQQRWQQKEKRRKGIGR